MCVCEREREKSEMRCIICIEGVDICEGVYRRSVRCVSVCIPVRKTRMSPGGSVRWICMTAMRAASK